MLTLYKKLLWGYNLLHHVNCLCTRSEFKCSTDVPYTASQSKTSQNWLEANYEILTDGIANVNTGIKGAWGSGTATNAELKATFDEFVTVLSIEIGGGHIEGFGDLSISSRLKNSIQLHTHDYYNVVFLK